MPRKPLFTSTIYSAREEDERIAKSASNVRVNLSIPSYLYDLLVEYTKEQCLPSVPSACIQLIRLQLRAIGLHNAAMYVLKSRTAKEIKKEDPDTLQYIKDSLIDRKAESENEE